MIKEKDVICTICPKGCDVKIVMNEDKVETLSGYGCEKGKDFAINELINPVRTLTTTIRIQSETKGLLPVRTDKPIPFSMIFEVMKILKTSKVKAPVLSGDIIIENILDTSSNIIACEDIAE